MYEQQEEVIVRALYALWRGIDLEFKAKYRQKIWQMFENAVAVAARTSGHNTHKFLTRIAQKMNAVVGWSADDLEAVALLAQYDGRAVLSQVREEYGYLVAMVRLLNEKEQEKRNRDA